MTSTSALAFMGFGSTELLVVLLIILVLFGGSKLPSLAKGLGLSVKEFKKATRDDDEEKTSAETKKTEVEPTAKPPGGSA